MSYIETTFNNKKIKIPNIDSLLYLYYSMIMIEDIPIHKSTFLYYIYTFNDIITNYKKYIDNPLYNRFNLPCYGTQEDMQKIFYMRNKTYKKLSENKDSEEYQKWFFKYEPILKTQASIKKSKNIIKKKSFKHIKHNKRKNKTYKNK
jgi:hypothetical protein